MDTIFVKVNGELAARAKSIFSRYGVDMETALNMYLMQVISNVGASSLRQEKAEYVRPPFQFGSLKGVLNIDDDFSDVLADFKEYM
ncbi:MAG: hypothetical protein LBL26_01685 [Peptococcaceae bacterium]|jgi:hypothetical protein|nr:hypothetical protein [Peptococcaceae bacterium]